VTELDDVIWARHSARMFLPDKPFLRELLDEALALAMRAPSDSNTQPWRVFFTTGERRAPGRHAACSGGRPAATVGGPAGELRAPAPTTRSPYLRSDGHRPR
jgi:nitroreductase